MALILPLGFEDEQFIQVTIDNHDGKGAVQQTQLPAGQTLTVTSADPATVTITADTPAVADPDGSPSVASFTVKSAAAPAQSNVPITVTLLITNADGSTAATATDTITVKVGATEAVGDLFGVAIPIPAGARKK